jgi:dynein heavy chain
MYVLYEIDELYAMLDECLANLNNILGSRYLKNFRPKVEKLQGEIIYAIDTIDDWLICQKNWTYLENIFSSSDIKKRLSKESSQFEKVNKYILDTMKKTLKERFIFKMINNTDVGVKFKKHKETLNYIQK